MRCTISDWAKFALQHLRGESGRSDYLSAETYRRLHTLPLGGKYALGWRVEDGEWAGGRFLAHTGSDLLNFTRIYVLPEKGYAVLVCNNQNSGKVIAQGCAFNQENLHIDVGSIVTAAILTANQAAGGFRVENQAGRPLGGVRCRHPLPLGRQQFCLLPS